MPALGKPRRTLARCVSSPLLQALQNKVRVHPTQSSPRPSKITMIKNHARNSHRHDRRPQYRPSPTALSECRVREHTLWRDRIYFSWLRASTLSSSTVSVYRRSRAWRRWFSAGRAVVVRTRSFFRPMGRDDADMHDRRSYVTLDETTGRRGAVSFPPPGRGIHRQQSNQASLQCRRSSIVPPISPAYVPYVVLMSVFGCVDARYVMRFFFGMDGGPGYARNRLRLAYGSWSVFGCVDACYVIPPPLWDG
jgi:hypothetical protein